MSTPIVPFTPPLAPSPEPEAILRFGDIEIRLGLTYLHHLVNCQGWGDPGSSYHCADRVMQKAVRQILCAMGAEIDRAAGR